MKNYLFAALLGTSLLGMPMLVGCDSGKESTKKEVETTHSDGSTTVDKSKSTTDANGNTKTDTEHKTTP
ncbi:MAG TPA: hypothetical protein VG326_19815 [Tepidisphaeraceae bacterium]|jgi:hypothetical protein|nr:hypothetical protein [Tepidisphaeraceae bacterium]